MSKTASDLFSEYANYSVEQLENEKFKQENNIVQFAKDGLYEEADEANKKAEYLKKRVVDKKKELIQNQMKTEMDELEQAYAILKEQFNVLWDSEISKFEIDELKQTTSLDVFCNFCLLNLLFK
jgi:hypothetical protein